MRNTLVMCALLAIAGIASAADNSIGTWVADAAKSLAAPGMSPIKNMTVVRAAIPGGADVTVKGLRADGTKIDAHYAVKYDGKAVAIAGTGLAYDTISITQVDANTLSDHRRKQGNQYNAAGRFTVAKDGKTAELNVSGTDADGRPFISKTVYTRQ
jgi:hypothetical protein